MPNTIRSVSELTDDIFIDNGLGLITAQNMRDFVVSANSWVTAGPQGVQGYQGMIGSQGYGGLTGLTGAQGYQGSGFQGLQGLVGVQGNQGVQGLVGVQGNQGLQGLVGVQGSVGQQGVQGAGFQGMQGVQGAVGLQGAGFQGAVGSQGVQGVQGAVGLQGNNGLGFYQLLVSGGCAVSGNTVTKTSGTTGWNAQAYSVDGYTAGAFMTFRAGQTNLGLMVGLDQSPSLNANFTSIDYAWNADAAGNANIYESGTSLGIPNVPYTTATVFSIIYDGALVNYYLDGVLQQQTSRVMGNPLYLDSSFYDLGAEINAIGFGPVGQGLQGSAGPTGPQGSPAPTSLMLTIASLRA